MTAASHAHPLRLRLSVGAAMVALASGVALGIGPVEPAQAKGCKRVLLKKFKIKDIETSTGSIACYDARRVAKRWVKSDYDDFNPIFQGDDRWFCSWRRKAPQSKVTGTAECDAEPGEEIDFAVRRRR